MTASERKSEILKRIEALWPSLADAKLSAQILKNDESGHQTSLQGQKSFHANDYLEALLQMVEKDQSIFGLEDWHALEEDGLAGPAEMLLRLQTQNQEPLPPYPFIMLCYNKGLTAALDSVLLLKGLQEFKASLSDQGKSQISINISARSLRDTDFVELALEALEKNGKNVVFEIHETSDSIANPQVLQLFKKQGVRFALDDVILNLDDMMRFANFNGITSFMKLDHKLLTDPLYQPLLGPTMSFIAASADKNRIVAEGVKTVDDARRLHEQYPAIKFVQGRELPDSKAFAKKWKKPV